MSSGRSAWTTPKQTFGSQNPMTTPDDPENFEPDFPDDAAFQMSAECLGEYDDEVSSRW